MLTSKILTMRNGRNPMYNTVSMVYTYGVLPDKQSA